MTDYVRISDFSAKDSLTTGDPSKKILGSEVDAELDAIVTHIATKADSTAVVAKTGGSFTGDVTFAKAAGNTTVTVDSADDAVLVLDKAASEDTAYLRGAKAGVKRWEVELGNATAESGSDAGSNFTIAAYDDAGDSVGTALTITRSSLQCQFGGTVIAAPSSPADPAHGVVGYAKGDNTTAYYGLYGYADTEHTKGGGVIGVAADGTTLGIVGYTLSGTDYSFYGNAGANLTSGAWGTTSDARLKTDLKRIDGALDRIEQLTGYTFSWTSTGARSTGLIAQDVQAVLPEAVHECDGYLSLDYGNLAGLLVEAIKELRVEINELKRRL